MIPSLQNGLSRPGDLNMMKNADFPPNFALGLRVPPSSRWALELEFARPIKTMLGKSTTETAKPKTTVHRF
jgi:hypothetical protein